MGDVLCVWTTGLKEEEDGKKKRRMTEFSTSDEVVRYDNWLTTLTLKVTNTDSILKDLESNEETNVEAVNYEQCKLLRSTIMRQKRIHQHV